MPSATDALERALEQVDRHEPEVGAFIHLDIERARREARQRDEAGGPLLGVVLGVKDIFDTFDQPTAYGSPIYTGYQPARDAGVVALLRAAGATCIGKTVTTEFASGASGKTRNPHRLSHTPGGSSSGSAAAIAIGMADLALGSQTLGSTIRPASFCGIWGYKATHGTLSTAGMKLVAESLDTVGLFARDVALLDLARTVLTSRAPMQIRRSAPSIAVFETDQSPLMDPDSADAIARAARHARDAGAVIDRIAAPPFLEGATDRARSLMGYEAARSLAYEHLVHREKNSPYLNDLLDMGAALPAEERDSILAMRALAHERAEEIFAGHDFLLYPSATGEAPEGLASTGDRRFQALWTLLGFPALSVPGLTGRTGLPVGVQLIARPGADAELLSAGAWLGSSIST